MSNDLNRLFPGMAQPSVQQQQQQQMMPPQQQMQQQRMPPNPNFNMPRPPFNINNLMPRPGMMLMPRPGMMMMPPRPGMMMMPPPQQQQQQQQQNRPVPNALAQLLPGLGAPSVHMSSPIPAARPTSNSNSNININVNTNMNRNQSNTIAIADYPGNPDVGVQIPHTLQNTDTWLLRRNLPPSTDAKVLVVAKTKTALAYNNGSRLVVTGPYICYALNKGKLRVINLETTEKCLVRPDTDAPTDVEVVDLCPRRDLSNHFAMVTSDGTLRAMAVQEIVGEDGQTRQPQCVDLLKFKHPAAGGVGRSFHRVVWGSNNCLALADGMNAVVLRIGTFDANQLVTATHGSDIEAMQAAGATVMRGHKSDVSDLQFSEDGTQLVTASDDGFVRVWNVNTGECIHQFEPEDGRPVSSVTLLTGSKGSGSSNSNGDAMSCSCVVGTDRDSFLRVYERLGDPSSLTQCIEAKVGPEVHEIGGDGFDGDNNNSGWVHMYNRCIWQPDHGVLLCRNVRVKEEDVDNSGCEEGW